jgi:hypothetical protein
MRAAAHATSCSAWHAVLACALSSAAISCASELRVAIPMDEISDGGLDGSSEFGQGDNPTSIVRRGAGRIADGGRLDVDAFFVDDPPPPMCGPDGDMEEPGKIEGSADCPSDKNREGCPCDKVGEKRACWPGKRVHRMRGRCKDGTATCGANTEFGSRWGPCQDYVLPVEGATQGPDACGCFSNGKWVLNNLVPCVYQDDKNIYVYSSKPTEKGYECEPVSMTPPPAPAADWASSTLNVDCAGQYKLCYTMKAGRVADPKSDDCVLMQQCIDVWYGDESQDVKLPNLRGWTAKDLGCAREFIEQGGYGEMSVQGKSADCEAVDDGKGKAYVFKRTSYCLPSCAMTPNLPECMGCATGGSGQF